MELGTFHKKAEDFMAGLFGGQIIEEKKNLMRKDEKKEEKIFESKPRIKIEEIVEEIEKDRE